MHLSPYGNHQQASQNLPSQLNAYNHNSFPFVSNSSAGATDGGGGGRFVPSYLGASYPSSSHPNGLSNYSFVNRSDGAMRNISASTPPPNNASYASSHFNIMQRNMMNVPQSNMPPPLYPSPTPTANATAGGRDAPFPYAHSAPSIAQAGGALGAAPCRPILASPFAVKGLPKLQPQGGETPMNFTVTPPPPAFNANRNIPPPAAPPAGAVNQSTSNISTFNRTCASVVSPYYLNSSSSASSSFYPNSRIPAYTSHMHNSNVDPTQQENLAREAQQYNALYTFIRSSINRLPTNASIKQKSHLPIGLVIQSLAKTPEGFPQVPVVNFGASVVRCRKCRTYMNPFVSWEANGRKWTCNLCATLNDTPQCYIYPLDENGKREDRFERCELSCGSIEIIAPTDYMVRPPQPPSYMFVIDVSANAINSGMVSAACQAIKQCITNSSIGEGDSRTLFGLITFDSVVHFYNLNNSLSQPQLLVVSDLSELFLPLPNDILVNLYDSTKILMSVLDSLPSLWNNNKNAENCLCSAIKAAYMSMKHIGGKMCVFTSSSPTCGEYSLRGARDELFASHATKSKGITSGNETFNKGDAKADKEIDLTKPANDSYFNFATTLTQSQICVDMFVCVSHASASSASSSHSLPFVDLASLAVLSKYTGGEVRYYPYFNSHIHANKFKNELMHVLSRTTGWESVMRIRVSRGWKISSWSGHFYFRGNDLLVIPNCHENQTFTITLDMEENVVQDALVYVQSALLYTNCHGERRIRVHTYCLPVTSTYADLMCSMDPQCVASIIVQNAIQISLKTKLSDARSYIQNTCAQILSACSSIPNCEASKILSLYILGMLKSSAFRDCKDVSSDMRVYIWNRLQNLSVDMISAYLYPRLLQVHQIENDLLTSQDETNLQLCIPTPLNLTNEKLTQEGAYLLEDGENMLLWIGRGIDARWLESVFGVSSLDLLHPDYAENVIGTTGNSIGNRIGLIINALRESRNPPYMKLTLIRQGDPNEHIFFSCLIEDRTHALMMSLSEFLAKFGMRTQLTTPAI